MGKVTRKRYGAEFKAKVALDAIKGELTAYSDDPARVFQPSSAHRSNLMPPTIPI